MMHHVTDLVCIQCHYEYCVCWLVVMLCLEYLPCKPVLGRHFEILHSNSIGIRMPEKIHQSKSCDAKLTKNT